MITHVPELRRKQQLDHDDASDELELEGLSSRIPKLIGVLPDVMRTAKKEDVNRQMYVTCVLVTFCAVANDIIVV